MREPDAEEDIPENAPPLNEEQAIANLNSPDTGLRYYAAWWLGKFRVNSSSAVNALIAALEDEADRTELGGYPLRRNAARALGKLGFLQAVNPLIKCLECPDFYVREASAQSLEMLGDVAAAQPLMELLSGGVAAAVQVPGRPHLVQPYEAVLEALGTIGVKEAIPLIQPFLEHPLPRVQCAAARAMYQLTQEASYGDRLVKVLDSDDLKLRRVALSDLGAIGYMASSNAIASSKVENSFKIIALKGLLEHQLSQKVDNSLDEDTIKVMNLMDALL